MAVIRPYQRIAILTVSAMSGAWRVLKWRSR